MVLDVREGKRWLFSMIFSLAGFGTAGRWAALYFLFFGRPRGWIWMSWDGIVGPMG